jgi:hypothetical protein
MHEYAGFGDFGKVYELLLGFDEDAGFALRCAGYQKARELLTLHKDNVDLLNGPTRNRSGYGCWFVGMTLPADRLKRLVAVALPHVPRFGASRPESIF